MLKMTLCFHSAILFKSILVLSGYDVIKEAFNNSDFCGRPVPTNTELLIGSTECRRGINNDNNSNGF